MPRRKKPPEKVPPSNGVIPIGADEAPTRIVTSRGVVLVIDGSASASVMEVVVQEAERRYPEPPPPSVTFDQYDPPVEEAITEDDDAAYWAAKDPDKYGDMPTKLSQWRDARQLAMARAAGFVMTEMVCYGVTVDEKATKANGASIPDFTRTWRDFAPAYRYDEDGEPVKVPPSAWEQYLLYALPTTQEWGAVSAAIKERLGNPTAEGVASAIELFRTTVSQQRQRRVEGLAGTPGVATEGEQEADAGVDVGARQASGEGVGADAG